MRRETGDEEIRASIASRSFSFILIAIVLRRSTSHSIREAYGILDVVRTVNLHAHLETRFCLALRCHGSCHRASFLEVRRYARGRNEARLEQALSSRTVIKKGSLQGVAKNMCVWNKPTHHRNAHSHFHSPWKP